MSLNDTLVSALREHPVLFCGAGCSARANVPTWEGYLEQLARFADGYEPEIASLMRRRIKEGAFLVAATFFKRYLSAPPGEKLAALCDPFKQDAYVKDPLLPLASLPLSAVVTTNYDASLFEAMGEIAAQRSQPAPHLLRTRDVKGVAYITDRFFLFLHGQAGLPLQAEHMVFDEEDYRSRYNDPAFTDGLLSLLSTRTCLFLGFSFRDPGFNAILELWKRLKGPTFPRKHYAVLPSNQDELAYKLTAMNVEVLRYDHTPDHSVLWQTIRTVASTFAKAAEELQPKVAIPVPHRAAREILAMTYARARLGTQILPLRNTVVDGVVLAVLNEAALTGLANAPLTARIGQQLGIPPAEIEAEVVLATQRLERLGIVNREGDRVVVSEPVPDTLTPEMAKLARHLIQRIHVREGIEFPDSVLPALSRLFEDLFIARAWDLAAHFIQPRAGIEATFGPTIERIVGDTDFGNGVDKELLKRSVLELVERPNTEESALLSELGRLAFAVQLALDHARTTLSYAMTLPQRVYLDASVLMPAIIEGHSLYPVYNPVLRRLREQVQASGGQVKLLTASEFLNEIIRHRQLAIREVKERTLEDPERLQRDVLLFTAQNLNVFVGAYATHVGRAKRKVSFANFLKDFAPFETEETLADWLEKRDFEVVRLDQGTGGNRPLRYSEWVNALQMEYGRTEAFAHRPKPKLLVEHEASQMFQLEREYETGIRSVFVTADGRLRRAVSAVFDGRLADALLSGVSMVSLVDLLLGVRIDHRGLARLLWGVHALDPEGKVRQYFTDKGLALQGDVETLALPKVVETIAGEIAADPRTKVFAETPDDSKGRGAFADYLDRFEDRFYSLLQAAVKDRLAKEQPSAHRGAEVRSSPRRRGRRSRRRR